MNEEFQILLEDNVGAFSHSPRYYVNVYDKDDGYIPHFHVYGKNSGGKVLDTCIEIDHNRYFRHGIHKGTITDGKERKLLNKFLHSKPTSKEGRIFDTNWSYIKYLWNNGNKIMYSNAVQIPDYTTILPESKNDPRLKNLKPIK